VFSFAADRAREFFIDNLLVRIHFIIEMIRWTGLAPWEFKFPFPGSLTSTFLIGRYTDACAELRAAVSSRFSGYEPPITFNSIYYVYLHLFCPLLLHIFFVWSSFSLVRTTAVRFSHLPGTSPAPGQTEIVFFIDNLLFRLYFITEMIKRTGFAPWEFELPFHGSLISTFGSDKRRAGFVVRTDHGYIVGSRGRVEHKCPGAAAIKFVCRIIYNNNIYVYNKTRLSRRVEHNSVGAQPPWNSFAV